MKKISNKTFWLVVNIFSLLLCSIIVFLFVSNLFTNLIVNEGVNFAFNIPFYVCFGSYIVILLLFILSQYRKASVKFYLILSYVMMGLGLIGLIVSGIFLTTHFEGNLFVTGPIANYPLVCILISSITVVSGLVLFYFRKEIVGRTMNREFTKGVVWHHFFVTALILFGTYFFGDFIIGIIAFDLTKNILGQILVLLYLLMPTALMVYYIFFYRNGDFKNRLAVKTIGSTICCGATFLLQILILVYEGIHPDFVVESMQPVFGFTFAASIPVGFIIIDLFCGVLGLVFVIPSIIKYAKFKKAEKAKISEQAK